MIGPGTDARVHGGGGQMFCLPEMIWVHWMRASRRKLGCESTGPAPDRAVVGTEHVVGPDGRLARSLYLEGRTGGSQAGGGRVHRAAPHSRD